MPKMNLPTLEKYIESGKKSFYDFDSIEIDYDTNINEYQNKPISEDETKTHRTKVFEDYTVLHVAIEAENPGAVRWLLENGANPALPKKTNEKESAKERFGWKPVSSEWSHTTCIELAGDNQEISTLLNNALAKKEKKNNNTAAALAAAGGPAHAAGAAAAKDAKDVKHLPATAAGAPAASAAAPPPKPKTF